MPPALVSSRTMVVDRYQPLNKLSRAARPFALTNLEMVAYKKWTRRALNAVKVMGVLRARLFTNWRAWAELAVLCRRRANAALGPRFVTVERPVSQPLTEIIYTCGDALHHHFQDFAIVYRLKNANMFMTTMHGLGICDSLDLADPGRDLRFRESPDAPVHLFSGVQVALMYLQRLGGTTTDLELLGKPYGMGASRVSRALQAVSQLMYESFSRDLLDWHKSFGRLSAEFLIRMQGAVRNIYKVNWIKHNSEFQSYPATIRHTFGMLDGTFQSILRPSSSGENDGINAQRHYYNGNQGDHGVHFTGVVLPNGLIIAVDGPYPGRENDLSTLQLGKLHLAMANHFAPLELANDTQFCLLGDGIYQNFERIRRVPTQTDIDSGLSTEVERKAVAHIRAAIENAFGTVLQLFPYFNHWTKHSISRYVGRDYFNAVLLVNCRTCIEGSLLSTRFELLPPLLAEYLRREEVFR